MFTDPRTLIAGIVGFLATTAAHFNFIISADWQSLIIAAVLLAFGLVAGDAKK